MLKSLFALIRHGIDLWNRLGKLEDRTSELTREQDRLNGLVEQLARDAQRDRENAAHEREKLKLQLENALLKFERRLPPERPGKGK